VSSIFFAIFIALLPSPIRIFIYRLFGSKIGKRVKIGLGTIILSNNIEIGDNSKIGYFCMIKVNTLSLGKYVSIGNFVKISVYKIRMDSRAIVSPDVKIEGDRNDKRSVIKLGMHSWIFQHCYVNVLRQVNLGKNVGVGGGSYLFTHGFWLSKLHGFPVSYGPIYIDDNVWLPWSCFIMPNVKIGKNVIVGARSLVNKDVPENALVAGSPAKIIKEKCFREVSLEEKSDIISEVIHDFAERKSKKVNKNETDQTILFSLDKVPLIIIHKNFKKNTSELSMTALNIFFDKISNDLLNRYPFYSVNNNYSSSVDIMPKIAVEWLGFARYIGLRFYAIDEM
jgi:acetyltransferase-like isoleucine patch superfamily enzyme